MVLISSLLFKEDKANVHLTGGLVYAFQLAELCELLKLNFKDSLPTQLLAPSLIVGRSYLS